MLPRENLLQYRQFICRILAILYMLLCKYLDIPMTYVITPFLLIREKYGNMQIPQETFAFVNCISLTQTEPGTSEEEWRGERSW